MINKSSKIFITGHRGMVGSVTLNHFRNQGYNNLLTATHQELNLINQAEVNEFMELYQPEYVIHIAAKVGGINANILNPGVFLFDNLMMQNNLIDAAQKIGVKKFVFLGSSCIYPKESLQPMKEEYLLKGPLEPTNEGYAIAKIAGIKLLQSYHKQYDFNGISLMPSNLYGPNDSFDLAHAHVLSSLVKRFTDAQDEGQKEITLWGTGVARREFLHVHDMARAILFFFENYNSPEIVNIGPGTDISIKQLAEMIADKVGYKGQILWDSSKPDGMLRKCMDVSNMKNLGYETEISLETGIDEVIESYKLNKNNQKVN